MRRISFRLTEDLIRRGTKTVTRRRGWRDLRPETCLLAVDRIRVPGARVIRVIEVVSVRREWLRDITPEDVVREGWPIGTPVSHFLTAVGQELGLKPSERVTRIEFAYVPECWCEILHGPPCNACTAWAELAPEDRRRAA